MSFKYVSVPHGDLGGSGIDSLSSEDSIQEGYAEDLKNVDASPQGYLSKRAGYQQLFGQLPVRVLSAAYKSGLNGAFSRLEFTLDKSIDLSNIPSQTHSRPILVSGTTSSQNGTGSQFTATTNYTAHTLLTSTPPVNGTPVRLTFTGVAPTLLSEGVTYWVVNRVAGTSFQVSLSLGGTAIPFTDSGSPLGTLTVEVLSGDFPSNEQSTNWYPGFSADTRRLIPLGDSTILIPQTEHALNTPYIWVGTSQSLSTVNRDNTQLYPAGYVSGSPDTEPGVTIDATSHLITVRQENGGVPDPVTGIPGPFDEFIYWSSKSPVPGSVFVSSVTTSSSGTIQLIFPPTGTAGHNLTSPNILAQIYEVISGTYRQIQPESVDLLADGTVRVTVLNGTGASVSLFAVLSTTSTERSFRGRGIGGGQTLQVQIPNPPTPFMFVSCYVESDPTLHTLTSVIPESVTYSEATNETTVSFVWTGGDPAQGVNFSLFWEPAYIISNRLTVQAYLPASAGFADTAPQLTIWGLDHSLLYSRNAGTRAGWVSHLDTYRSAGNNFLVAGLGGNLFQGKSLSTPERAQWGVPTLYPNLRNRILGTFNCGPVFVAADEVTTSIRTGGVLGGRMWGSGFAYSSSIEYIDAYGSPEGRVRVTFEDPDLAQKGTPILDNTDLLTIEQAGKAIHNGSWLILSHTIDLVNGILTIDFKNTSILSQVLENPAFLPPSGPTNLWNSTTGARCGIFSGSLTVQETPHHFLPGDFILSENLTGGEQIQVTKCNSNTIYLNNFYKNEVFPTGTFLVGKRTSSILPLRTAGELESVDLMVGTDNLQITGFLREFKVHSINPLATQTVSILGDGHTATVTFLSSVSTTDVFALGDNLLLAQAGDFSGEFVVSGIPNQSTVTFLSSVSGSIPTAYLVGKTVHIDEKIEWQDSPVSAVQVQVPSRWLPLEAPTHSVSAAESTHVRYLSNSAYDEQPILRSTQVADTLFLNNGDDRALKIDGSNLYRPGLPRWQAELFFSQATAAGQQSIQPIQTSVLLSSPGGEPLWANNHFSVSESDVLAFSVGTRIRRALDPGTIYTVTAINTGTGSSVYQIFVDKTITPYNAPVADTLTSVSTYSYYFRLNAVDANQNVVASAATGVQDCVLNITTGFQNRIRMVGLPAFDIYDYDRLELQIYRTKQNGVAPYYLLATKVIPFGEYQGYIDYTDTKNDSDINASSDLDPVNTALKGAELGTGWSPPIRAKHLTSAANRLILGNLTSDPYIDLSIRNIGSTVSSSDLSGDRFLLRKSNEDTAIDTDMLNRIGYEFISGTGSLLTISDLSWDSVNQIVTVTTSSAHSLIAGNWVYLFADAANTNLQTHLMGWWQLLTGSGTQFTFKWTPSDGFGTSVPATVAGGSPGVFTSTAHGLLPGQKVKFSWTGYVFGGAGAPVQGVDYFVATTPTANTFTISNLLSPLTPKNFTVTTVGTSLSYIPSFLVSQEVQHVCRATLGLDVPVYLGTDLNYQTSNGQPSSSGGGIENLATRRLSNAINATQRVCTTSGFQPWIVANAGSSFSQGQIILTQPMNQTSIFELVLPSILTYSVFANGVQRAAGEQIQAREDLHPSRILISYPNFPEIFDSPFSTVDSQSDSAIDINPADGQEITACIPFFGSSAFGAALKDAVVVVFKTNSIYVVNLAAKLSGQVAVQKIESQGLGCQAPNSVAPVRDGIMFANASGMYKLRTDLSVYYMGRHMQRQWRGRVTKGQLDLVFGHNWAFGSQFKLSVPVDGSSVPNEAFVYNSTREYTMEGSASTTQLYSSREGSWTRHTGFSSIGWCNLDSDSFYANRQGQVLKLRQLGEASDWRDDEAAIEMDIVLRATDFGDDGIRKTVPYALITYRNPLNLGVRYGTQVLYTTDLQDSFLPADSTVLPDRMDISGTSDTGGQKVVTLRYSFGNKRGIRFQIRIQNGTKDESVEVTRIRYSVAGLSIKGTPQAANSKAAATKA